MATIQLTLPDQQLSTLQRSDDSAKAEAINLTVDELLKQTIASVRTQSSASEKVIDYVLTKNKTLYERLA